MKASLFTDVSSVLCVRCSQCQRYGFGTHGTVKKTINFSSNLRKSVLFCLLMYKLTKVSTYLMVFSEEVNSLDQRISVF